MPFDNLPVTSPRSLDLLAEIGGHLTRRDIAAARGNLWMWAHDPALLDGLRLDPEPGQYRRELIWRRDAMSAWLFLWAPGSATPVHDHHCLCCYGVLRGSLTETVFRADGAGGVIPAGRLVRDAGTTNALVPESPNIHAMVNESDSVAVTMHLYGFCPERHANSVRAVYSLASVPVAKVCGA